MYYLLQKKKIGIITLLCLQSIGSSQNFLTLVYHVSIELREQWDIEKHCEHQKVVEIEADVQVIGER